MSTRYAQGRETVRCKTLLVLGVGEQAAATVTVEASPAEGTEWVLRLTQATQAQIDGFRAVGTSWDCSWSASQGYDGGALDTPLGLEGADALPAARIPFAGGAWQLRGSSLRVSVSSNSEPAGRPLRLLASLQPGRLVETVYSAAQGSQAGVPACAVSYCAALDGGPQAGDLVEVLDPQGVAVRRDPLPAYPQWLPLPLEATTVRFLPAAPRLQFVFWSFRVVT